jgi:hypothetical protein
MDLLEHHLLATTVERSPVVQAPLQRAQQTRSVCITMTSRKLCNRCTATRPSVAASAGADSRA